MRKLALGNQARPLLELVTRISCASSQHPCNLSIQLLFRLFRLLCQLKHQLGFLCLRLVVLLAAAPLCCGSPPQIDTKTRQGKVDKENMLVGVARPDGSYELAPPKCENGGISSNTVRLCQT